jgi:hypothetical protein
VAVERERASIKRMQDAFARGAAGEDARRTAAEDGGATKAALQG